MVNASTFVVRSVQAIVVHRQDICFESVHIFVVKASKGSESKVPRLHYKHLTQDVSNMKTVVKRGKIITESEGERERKKTKTS